MAETVNMDKMYRELLALRKEVQFIKDRMVEIEIVMTPQEEARLEESLEKHKKGKTKRLEDLKEELGD